MQTTAATEARRMKRAERSAAVCMYTVVKL
jgi:hypothetical protein